MTIGRYYITVWRVPWGVSVRRHTYGSTYGQRADWCYVWVVLGWWSVRVRWVVVG